jgi:hypothetical protein
MPEPDELTALFVPEAEGQRFEALKESDRLDLLEERICIVTALEIVVRNTGAEMMNMVKADIPGKPLQDLGQFVKRTAFERSFCVIPVFAAFPVNAIELMLHIEQPHTSRPGDCRDHQLNQEVGFQSEDQAQACGHREDREIHPVNRVTFAFVRLS